MLEVWRTEKKVIDPNDGEAVSAFGLHDGPNPVVELADTILPASENRIQWFHRNENSIWSENLKYQGLESLIPTLRDPLLHRTFGGLMVGDGVTPSSDQTLTSSKPATHHHIRIITNTAQTDLPDQWIEQTERLLTESRLQADDAARAAHEKWWSAFWDRSWIHVSGPPAGSNITATTLPLRIGADSDGQHIFRGTIADARLYARALSAEELANPPADAAWKQDGEKAFDGRQWIEVANDPKLNPGRAITLMARVRPKARASRWIRS